MLLSSIVQHRAKHFDRLLARELSLIERKHLHNLLIHEKFENSIRQTNNSLSNNYRTKISAPFNNIYNKQTGSIDDHKIRNNNSNQKRRRSFGGGGGGRSISSPNQTFIDHSDEFSDDISSYISLRRRPFCTKSQRLPPIIKANTLNQRKRENKNHHWITNFQQSIIPIENIDESFTILNEEISKINLSELSPIQKQVRSFLETLPTYKGIQHGFDSFAPASLYSNRAPVVIR